MDLSLILCRYQKETQSTAPHPVKLLFTRPTASSFKRYYPLLVTSIPRSFTLTMQLLEYLDTVLDLSRFMAQ